MVGVSAQGATEPLDYAAQGFGVAGAECAAQVVDAKLGDAAGYQCIGGLGARVQATRVAVYLQALTRAQAAYGALALPVVLADFVCLHA